MAEVILIVEDEPDLAATVEFNLAREGYQTRMARDGANALRLAALEPVPDLVLLDLMLPDLSGTEVCRRLKASERTANVPVVMVTAKADEIDRVVGFEVGADDYVVKPFSVRELVLRVRAILRRSRAPDPADGPSPAEAGGGLGGDAPPGSTRAFGCLLIQPEAHRVYVEDEEVVLTALEFELLRVLLDQKGRVLSRDRLLRDVWDITADVNTRTVDTHIKRLRQKLGAASRYVETLRGVGYRFKDRPES